MTSEGLHWIRHVEGWPAQTDKKRALPLNAGSSLAFRCKPDLLQALHCGEEEDGRFPAGLSLRLRPDQKTLSVEGSVTAVSPDRRVTGCRPLIQRVQSFETIRARRDADDVTRLQPEELRKKISFAKLLPVISGRMLSEEFGAPSWHFPRVVLILRRRVARKRANPSPVHKMRGHPVGSRIFTCPWRPDRLRGSPDLLFNG
jgi:hypothetical protein